MSKVLQISCRWWVFVVFIFYLRQGKGRGRLRVRVIIFTIQVKRRWFITSAKNVMFLSLFVCLSACLSARWLNKLWTNFDDFFGGMGCISFSSTNCSYILVVIRIAVWIWKFLKWILPLRDRGGSTNFADNSRSFRLKIHQNTTKSYFCWRFGLYQRPTSEKRNWYSVPASLIETETSTKVRLCCVLINL